MHALHPRAECDFVRRAPQQFETVTRDGQEVQEVLYGGTRDGVPVGGTRFYLGNEFIAK